MTSVEQILFIFVCEQHRNNEALVTELLNRGHRVRGVTKAARVVEYSTHRGVSGAQSMRSLQVLSEPLSSPRRIRSRSLLRATMSALRGTKGLVVYRNATLRLHERLFLRFLGVRLVRFQQRAIHRRSIDDKAARTAGALIELVHKAASRTDLWRGLSPCLGTGSSRRVASVGLEFVPFAVEPSPETLRESHAELRIVSVTRCHERKNNEGLLVLATILADDELRFRVVFSCSSACDECGGTGSSFAERVAALGLESVEVTGTVKDIRKIYRDSHVCLRLSQDEGANYSHLEAAAEGCIPIVSPTIGTAHGYVAENGGFIVRFDDYFQQASIIRSLSRDVSWREQMRKDAQLWSRKFTHPSLRANRLVELFSERYPVAAKGCQGLPMSSEN